jgi:hypothetical protein
VSHPEDRERILADALAHVEAQEKLYRVIPGEARRSDRWKEPVAVILLLLATVLTFFPPPWLAPTRLPSVSDADKMRGVRAALYMQAQQIEAYHLRTGHLPDALDQVAGRFQGIRFVRSNSRVYQLVGHGPDGSPVVYDSAHPDPGFAEAAAPFKADGVTER